MCEQDDRSSGHLFPCVSLGEALPQLRRPPTPAAVRFKIQNAVNEVAQVAAYVDARLVFDRLDHVCGERWSAAFDELPKALIPPPVDRNGELKEPPPVYACCRLTLYGVTREDVGEGRDPKAAFSDAVKRAAVHFGIGRALYAMRSPWLREGDGDGELRRSRKGRLVLDARSEAWCREMYERWLSEGGGKQFGEPLDHGDEAGAAGFDEQSDQPATESARPEEAADLEAEPQDGERADAASVAAAGRLRAVSDGEPGDPPATALDRQQIAHWRLVGRYKDETIAALAELLVGEKLLERLSHAQVRTLSHTLEYAVRGQVAQPTLAGAITRLAKREDRDLAAQELERWLRQKAAEAGPHPARAA
jgi:Rad52/22 family double-strand break repair protein